MCGVLCLSLSLCPFYFCNHLDEEERDGCSAIIIFRMSFYCKLPVAFPHVAVGGSAVCVIVVFPDHTHLLYAYLCSASCYLVLIYLIQF